MRLFGPFFFILLLTIASAVPVVQATHHESKTPGTVYVNSDGRIYVKSGQPIYLRLAVSPDEDANSYLLRNDASRNVGKPAAPLYFEGHGLHTLVHPEDHKNVQKRKGAHLFRVYDDGLPPKTKIDITKAPRATVGKTVVFGKQVTLTLVFTDRDSGLFASYFSIDNFGFDEYMTPLQFSMEKDYVLKFYALDNVGNRTEVKTRHYALDFTPPKTSHEVKGPHIGNILSPKATIHLSSFDAKAGVKTIQYRFKGVNGVYKHAPLKMSGLEDGQQELKYSAVDRVDNREESFEYSFYLDKIPPMVLHRISGDKHRRQNVLYVSARSLVHLNATDNKAGVRRIRYYVAKDRRGTIFAEPFSLPPKNGPTTFSYAASDNVINISKKTTKKVTVDVSAPKIKPVFRGEHYFSRKKHYIRRATKISFSAKDNLSGVQSISYVLDYNLPVGENREFTVETEGLHRVDYSATDNVNNETETKSMNLFVDEVSPEVFHHFSIERNVPDQEIYPPKTLLFLASTDQQSGIRSITYSINDGTKRKYVSALPFAKTGNYTVDVETVDHVGNVSSKSISFQIRKF